MLRNRKGFTLIELLIVVVIIGILAAIALPKFGKTREAAYFTTLKSDLNSLRSAEEMYYQTSGSYSYTNDTTAIEFSHSNGVTLTITLKGAAPYQAWTATAEHMALDGKGCAIGYGEFTADPGLETPGGTAVAYPTQMGAPVCDD